MILRNTAHTEYSDDTGIARADHGATAALDLAPRAPHERTYDGKAGIWIVLKILKRCQDFDDKNTYLLAHLLQNRVPINRLAWRVQVGRRLGDGFGLAPRHACLSSRRCGS